MSRPEHDVAIVGAGVTGAALLSEDGYAVDFGRLCGAFLADARATGKPITEIFGSAVRSIERRGDGWALRADAEVAARVVVVAAGAYSLRFARGLGYGRHLGVLPVAGDFYVSPKALEGKVYTVQDDRLPFAAVHGDPDLNDPSVTRFGPRAPPGASAPSSWTSARALFAWARPRSRGTASSST